MPTENVGDQTLFALFRDEIKFHQLFERSLEISAEAFSECHVRPET